MVKRILIIYFFFLVSNVKSSGILEFLVGEVQYGSFLPADQVETFLSNNKFEIESELEAYDIDSPVSEPGGDKLIWEFNFKKSIVITSSLKDEEKINFRIRHLGDEYLSDLYRSKKFNTTAIHFVWGRPGKGCIFCGRNIFFCLNKKKNKFVILNDQYAIEGALEFKNIIDKDKEKKLNKIFTTKRDKLSSDFKSEQLDLMSKIKKTQENFEKTFKIEDGEFTNITPTLKDKYRKINIGINRLKFSNRNLLSNYSFENDLGETTGQAIKNYKDYSKKISKTLTAFNQKIETYEKNKNEILAKLSKFGKLINENERIIEQLNKKGTLLQELNQDSYHKHISNYLSKVDVIKKKILFVKNSGELDKININSFAELNLIKTKNSQYTLEELEDRVEQKRIKDKIDNVLEENPDEIPA